MKTPVKTRAAALVASILITFTLVHLVASYAYPEAPLIQSAYAAT